MFLFILHRRAIPVLRVVAETVVMAGVDPSALLVLPVKMERMSKEIINLAIFHLTIVV